MMPMPRRGKSAGGCQMSRWKCPQCATMTFTSPGSSPANLRRFRGSSVCFPAQLGELTMMTCGKNHLSFAGLALVLIMACVGIVTDMACARVTGHGTWHLT
jgi:hypothetical protein